MELAASILARTEAGTGPHLIYVPEATFDLDGVIADAIEEHDVDLLVMGTIARGGIPGFLLGNTAERLFSQINCSVLAIKPDDFVSPVTLESES